MAPQQGRPLYSAPLLSSADRVLATSGTFTIIPSISVPAMQVIASRSNRMYEPPLSPPSKIRSFLRSQLEPGPSAKCKPTLINQIHPLFDQRNFSKPIDYNVLKPALRLASRILDMPICQHFFFMIFFGEKRDAGNGMTSLHSTKTVFTMTDEDHKAVNERFLKMAKSTTFRLCEYDGVVDGGTTCVPTSDVDEADSESKQRRKLTPEQIAAIHIHIGKGFYDAAKVRSSSSQIEGTLSPCVPHFAIGNIILHELAHAAYNVTWGEEPESFLGNSLVGELGLELEARLFGGRVVIAHTVTDLPQVIEWPHILSISDVVLRRNVEALSNPPKQWWMEEDFVVALLQEWFWCNMYFGLLDSRALVPYSAAKAIQDAINAGERPPVPQSLADIFRNPNEFVDQKYRQTFQRSIRA